ncbi:MAG: hypothetical protein VXW34_00535, partial [Actinomycetota bacterium]|nr:hypothetical protein [Actinomycetota bacterium]
QGLAAYVLEVGTIDESSLQFPTAEDLLLMVDERCDEFKSTVPAVLPLVPDETAWNVAGGPYACLSVSTG